MSSMQEQLIMEQFDSFCKKVLKNKARDIYRMKRLEGKRLVSLTALNSTQLGSLSKHDTYSIDEVLFDINGLSILVKDCDIAFAISQLPMPSQKIVLMYFFLGMSDTEIASELHLARGTVYYHKKKGLRKIKEYLEVQSDEGRK